MQIPGVGVECDRLIFQRVDYFLVAVADVTHVVNQVDEALTLDRK
jgi:hypothetical protein